jgi:hypothetical protein
MKEVLIVSGGGNGGNVGLKAALTAFGLLLAVKLVAEPPKRKKKR